MIANEETQTLSNLGLTISQATIYLSLIKFESATVKALCRVSSIARQDIYQALSDLYELGLVERIVDKPLRFRAIPIKNALEILQQHRTIKNSNLDSRARTLFKHSKYWNKQNVLQIEPFFELRTTYRNDPRVKEAYTKAKDNIRLLGGKLKLPIFYSFLEDAVNASKRGVKLQILLSSDQQIQLHPFLKGLTVEVRFTDLLEGANVILFDNKQMVVWENLNQEQVNHPQVKALWTNHHGSIVLAIDHFEMRWKSAIPLEVLAR
jgi:sugar-specific transcriptional regulator TrmB